MSELWVRYKLGEKNDQFLRGVYLGLLMLERSSKLCEETYQIIHEDLFETGGDAVFQAGILYAIMFSISAAEVTIFLNELSESLPLRDPDFTAFKELADIAVVAFPSQ